MLYLFPNVLFEEQDHHDFFPTSVEKAVYSIRGLIAEDEKNARKFLKRFTFSDGRTFRDIPIKVLSEHTAAKEIPELIQMIKSEGDFGLITDCGLPCLADPGALLVAKAAEQNIKVKTFAGPSSIVMALQLSGFYAQQFTFLGYLPRDETQLVQKLKEIEKQASLGIVQLFIEAPYRNQKLLEMMIKTLAPHIKLCVACDLTHENEEVVTLSVAKWKGKDTIVYNKRQVVFLISK